MPNLPWEDGAEYRLMHGTVDVIVYTVDASAHPVSGQCPIERRTCDSPRVECKYFGGVDNLELVRRGELGNGLCAHIKSGAAPDMYEYKRDNGRDRGMS